MKKISFIFVMLIFLSAKVSAAEDQVCTPVCADVTYVQKQCILKHYAPKPKKTKPIVVTKEVTVEKVVVKEVPVEKKVEVQVEAPRRKNRISLMMVRSRGELKQSSDGTTSNVSSNYNLAPGVEYQRMVSDRFDVGAGVTTHKDLQISVGYDF